MGDDKPESKRIFINHVDSFTGSNLAKYLSKCVVGASMDDEDPEEEEAAGEIEGFVAAKNSDSLYEIHGTIKKKGFKRPSSVMAILQYDTREEFFDHLVESDVIVYDISEDIGQVEEALWMARSLHDNFQWLDRHKIFILISSVMTWAKSKPTDPEDAETALTEEDQKKRKSHPNFKEQFNAEKEILRLGKKHKSKISMYVVVAGILYGAEEHILHSFFKKAWTGNEDLMVYGTGTNILPMIHVTDLAGIIQNIADSKPSNKYMLAVDDSKNTLEEIIKAISDNLHTGKVKKMSKEEVIMSNTIAPHDLEILLTDLRLDATAIKEDMKIKWISETGIVENMAVIVDEYKKFRNILPIKACILGPPGSGKSFYAEKLVEDYQLKHLRIRDVIDRYMESLDAAIAYPSKLKEEIEIEKEKHEGIGEEEALGDDYRSEELEEAETKAASSVETQERLMKNMYENDGRLFDEDLSMIFKETIEKRECKNHGFILDGFPKTIEQATLLFAPETEEEENVKNPGYNPIITPSHVFLIKASDALLRNRHSLLCANNPDEERNIMEEFNRRLKKYREINDDLESQDIDNIHTFFDLREIHPVILHLKEDLSKNNDDNRVETLNKIYYELGPPHIYEPDENEKAFVKLKQQEAKLQQQSIERENRKIKEAEMLTIRKHNQSSWNENLELVRLEQYEFLETNSLPLRNYLMHLVMPVLTEGLMDCSKVRTDDPIDYLSEFILRYNSGQKTILESEDTINF